MALVEVVIDIRICHLVAILIRIWRRRRRRQISRGVLGLIIVNRVIALIISRPCVVTVTLVLLVEDAGRILTLLCRIGAVIRTAGSAVAEPNNCDDHNNAEDDSRGKHMWMWRNCERAIILATLVEMHLGSA